MAEKYAPDLMEAEAARFIESHADRPFFLYLPFIEPHVAMQPQRRLVESYPDSWDDRPYRGQCNHLPHPRRRAGYAAMITHLDEHVGRVMEALRKHGLEERTIVLFSSDNGTTHPSPGDPVFGIGGVDAAFFKSTRGRRALHFREDFCGTGLLSAHWIQQSDEHSAEGFDIDPDPVAWGLAHNLEPLGEVASRYTVHLKDVRSPGHRPADLRVAQNFSYCVFKTRAEMLSYFRAARESLASDGLFVIDLHGGSEATEVMDETRRCGGFTYVWDQVSFFPPPRRPRPRVRALPSR